MHRPPSADLGAGGVVPGATDVVVIGAGPAGCVFATRMARLGFDVCLIERARFPRRHLGESLSPGVVPLLAAAGLAGALEEAGARRVRDVSTNWEGREAIRHDPEARGLIVDRATFDAALLACTAAAGVRVLQPALARAPTPTATGWRVSIEASGEAPRELQAALRGFLG